jgi:hypothetical protein
LEITGGDLDVPVVCAMSSGARRGLRYQAIGEEEMSRWAQRKS